MLTFGRAAICGIVVYITQYLVIGHGLIPTSDQSLALLFIIIPTFLVFTSGFLFYAALDKEGYVGMRAAVGGLIIGYVYGIVLMSSLIYLIPEIISGLISFS